jgi:glycosyltransferase involved in cell wall biosynthesis
LRCEETVPGENLTYVLYGGGSCSMYDAAKWRALDGMSEVFRPAYMEDLDLSFRAWRLAWPSVFAAGAKVVREDKTTTSRYFDPGALDLIVQANYLRFLAHAVSTPALYRRLWRTAVPRLSYEALRRAWLAPAYMTPLPRAAWPEDAILAIGGGELAIFQGVERRGKPVVLVVSAHMPFPPSHDGAVRMFNLARRAAENFDQVLIAFVDELQQPPRELLEVFSELVCVRRSTTHLISDNGRPNIVEDFDRPAFHAAISQTVRKWQPAIAQLEFTHMAQYAADCAPARTILVEHHIDSDVDKEVPDRGEDRERRLQYERWVSFEKHARARVDRVVAVSEKDRATIGAPHAVTLPNGVDIRRYRASGRTPDPARVLIVGAFQHPSSLLGVKWFIGRVWPVLAPLRPTLHVINGERREFHASPYRVDADLTAPGIEFDDFVADVRPAYERATVVAAPLLDPAGTNINLMEAMAMGKAIVSTTAGVNGLDRVRPGRDLVIADDPDDMAAAIALLLAEPDEREQLERHARDTAERYYDWDIIAKRQDALYRSLLA